MEKLAEGINKLIEKDMETHGLSREQSKERILAVVEYCFKYLF